MASNDQINTVFDEIDTNDDGKIDAGELRNWVKGSDKRPSSSSYDAANMTTATNLNYDRAAPIITRSAEETNQYLMRAGREIYRDPNPRIIRRNASENPLTFEQRVRVKYLRPPTPPAPEPIIIKEVRPSQPSPPPPLVIREQTQNIAEVPPLYLRERPPQPPPRLAAETRTRVLSPVPVPPRSVVIERFTANVTKPRDIIIERWLPYGPAPERRTVYERAPPPPQYPAPTHTIYLYDNTDTRVNRKFENLGVSREDPEAYLRRYGSSLLDSTALVHEARSAGVVEDLSTPQGSHFTQTNQQGSHSTYTSQQGSRFATIHPREYSSTCDYTEERPKQHYETSDCGTTDMPSGCFTGDTGRFATNYRKDGRSSGAELTQYI